MEIKNSKSEDIDEIFRLYDFASAHQQLKAVVVWPKFERSLVETELAENRQWKLLMDDSVACVWATTFSDEDIWGERNKDAAVYIHRIATNPAFRGHNFVSSIVKWAKEYAKAKEKDFVRLDTLGNNAKLIKHYTNAGFTFLGIHHLTNTASLPLHYQKEPNCCLFEMKV